MKLSKQTDYAFRTLIFLAEQPAGERVSIQQICDFFEVSPNHVSKVVMRLVRRGDVEALRGKGGGIRLAKPASDISLLEIVKEFETTLRPINCAEQPCRILNGCRLKGLLDGAVRAYLESLAPYSLADIAGGELQVLRIGG
ncbi:MULTISPECIES: Rrf2 family transcriptional regulator [Spongiibacter]|jgi:Rrf2 family nitric oxide-sensitive transcriptional repressor|uniref:Rrf2 family transcriptional regulator n=1 Tax=Spongiibacter TaxID=630749 RepID=UPI0003B31A4C|nr:MULTISPECIES: Rrf2 family transcriptional regulator [Spongiibacter]MAY38085.1 BadM/Rrf2 family transcriptional regulator [Spongiibacter sp.]MBI59419.1 BadM/Rrf2 family transcriptional regulator [Spongiibacter sp.]MBO6752766.1 Rrf2 family transcriptional regulator [Spongiibacter sp.]|tara:strand:- start:39890 stop:40312 length:423 start_codon:yes stop_codon:yes gene_type:complete